MRMALLTSLAMLAALLILAPLLWALSLSLRPPAMTFAVDGFGLPFVDFPPSLAAWRAHVDEQRLLPAFYRSSYVSLLATVLAMLLGAPAAYALARTTRRGASQLVVAGFILVRLIPPLAFAIPFYVIFHALGWLDGPVGLVLINATLLLPFAVIILREAFAELPVEIEEAAAIDGAGPVRIFAWIALPLILPSLAATAVIVFAFAWNDYLFALAFFARDFATLPLLVQAVGSPGPRGAAGLLAALSVPLLVALLAQRYIVRSLTFGAVKG